MAGEAIPPPARTASRGRTTPVRSLPLVEFDAAAADLCGELRARLERRGRPIGACDLLIAVQAVAAGLVLVTDNVREFRRVAGLRVENWRA